MTSKEINEFKTKAVIALGERRIVDTIELLRALPGGVPDYDIRADLDAVAEHYRYMLHYFTRGAEDPERKSNYDNLCAELRTIIDRCVRRLYQEAMPSQYYNVARTLAMHPERNLLLVLKEYEAAMVRLAGSFDIDGSIAKDRQNVQMLEKEIFERVWTNFPLDKTDETALREALDIDSRCGHSMRMRIIAAIGLGLMEFYDPRRIYLLCEVLDAATDEREATAAIVWLLISLFRYRSRKHFVGVCDRIAAAAEHPLWKRRVRDAYLELLRARDTERVTKRMRDELMPDIMKLGKDLWDKRTRDEMLGDIAAELEANPEWEDKLRESGMYDRMRELSEMTGDGADVFMGAFSHLKSFAFFNSIEAWFTPFDDTQPDVSMALGGELAGFTDMLCKMPAPCDNDKFSILFALQSAPMAQREMMSHQLDQGRAALEQSGLSGVGNGSNGNTRNYVQNLYRFFKLYSRRNEFFDPFAHRFFMPDIAPVRNAVCHSDTLRESADLLFKIEAWQHARESFEILIATAEPSAELYQKAGYCAEQMAEYNAAADYYGYADLMDGNSAWTLKRLSSTLRRIGQAERAISPLRRLCRMQPDSNAPMLNLAYSLIESSAYAEALEILSELESRGGDTRRLWRAIAWTSFMTGDYDTARKYYSLIYQDEPTEADLLNMGHLAWVEHRMADAINLYHRSMLAAGENTASLHDRITADFPALAPNGIDRSELPLILDAIRGAEL